MQITNSSKLYYFVLLILTQFFWAGNFVVGKIVHNCIPPFTLAFYRWMLVAIILFPFSFSDISRQLPVIKKNFVFIAILGVLSITIFTSFTYFGLRYTTIIKASLINAFNPTIIILFSLFIKKSLPSVKTMLGVFYSLIGVTFILTEGNLSRVLFLNYNIGDIIILIAAISWAIFSILLKNIPQNISPISFLFLTALIGDIMLFPAFLVEHHFGYVIKYNLMSIGSILYTAVFASILAFSFWNISVQQVGPKAAGHFLNLFPIFCSILSIIFLNEKMHYYHFIGASLVFLGIYFTRIKHEKA